MEASLLGSYFARPAPTALLVPPSLLQHSKAACWPPVEIASRWGNVTAMAASVLQLQTGSILAQQAPKYASVAGCLKEVIAAERRPCEAPRQPAPVVAAVLIGTLIMVVVVYVVVLCTSLGSFLDMGVERADWDLSKEDFSKHKKGESLCSPEFVVDGVKLKMKFFPQGCGSARPGRCSLFLHAPDGVTLKFRLTLDGATHTSNDWVRCDTGSGVGWQNFAGAGSTFSSAVVELLEVRRTLAEESR